MENNDVHTDEIIGIPGLEIERVERHQGIDVWAKPSVRPDCVHCQSTRLVIKATHSRAIKHTRQGNQVTTLHLRVPKYHGRSCKQYFRHPFVGVRRRYRASESYRLEVFEAHDGGVSQHKLSLIHNISPATVERWYQYHIVQRRSELKAGISQEFFG